jgi:phospholipid/cholesterol/gamma-HCH transport system substrate-binding protein
MIRRSTKIQLVAFLVLTVLGCGFVGARYVGLGNALLGNGYVVTADFADSGGIFTNAEVTYRGVTVGRVSALRLSPTGVRVDLRLDDGRAIPADTKAVVEDRSAVGEQYVDLQPNTAGGPFLQQGSTIPRSQTSIPLPTQTLLLNLDRLVRSVDRHDLSVVIDQLGKAFAGSGRDLQRIVDSGDALTRAATDALPETIRLIDDGRTVLGTQEASGSAIKSFSGDLRRLSATLRGSDGDLRKILDNGVIASQQLDTLLRTNRASITALLANLLTTGQVTVARLDGLQQVLITYPAVLQGGYTVVPGDGTSHFGLVTNANDPPPCTTGYGGTNRRSPAETSDVPANTDARCAEPRGSATDVRGAQNSPGPGGAAKVWPGGAAKVWPGGAAEVWPGGAADRRPGAPGNADSSDSLVSSSYVTGYDPISGLATGPGGTPLQIGSTGGQAAVFGEDSWQWLLLGPLSK